MKIVYIKAEVIEQQEKTITARLLNGFGKPEVQVHEDNTLTPAQEAVAEEARLKGVLRDVQALIEQGGANEKLTAATVMISEALR